MWSIKKLARIRFGMLATLAGVIVQIYYLKKE
jgi:hypothetical protein